MCIEMCIELIFKLVNMALLLAFCDVVLFPSPLQSYVSQYLPKYIKRSKFHFSG